MAARHLRDQVGGGRRDDHEIGVAREADVTDIELALRVEQVGEGALPGQRTDRERRDEFMAGFGQDAAHMRAALAQPTDQVERLVGGDAAADDENDALAGHESYRACRNR